MMTPEEAQHLAAAAATLQRLEEALLQPQLPALLGLEAHTAAVLALAAATRRLLERYAAWQQGEWVRRSPEEAQP